MINRYKNDDLYDDMYAYDDNYKVHVRIDPNNVIPGKKGQWGVYEYTGDDGQKRRIQLSLLNTFYRRNPGIAASTTGTSSTSTPTGSYLHLNDKTAPVITPNNGAYTYNEWTNSGFSNLGSLSNIYGDIDTKDELGIIGQLGISRAALDYINKGFKNPVFDDNGNYIGRDADVKNAAILLNKYANTEEGKPFREQLIRGQATLPNLAKYEAYQKTNEWTDNTDINYLNEARNSVDKKYNGAHFFMDYAGDKTWGTLANEFARNNKFREDYTVNGKHVMDRLNRDAGLGDGRTLIQIYNDIINKNPDLMNDDERKYRIFRDMTRRRFKLDNNFWNRYSLLPWSRDFLYGNNDIVFKGASIPTQKEGGQIFRMLFV